MIIQDPVLWALGLSTVATVLILLDRRAKSRLNLLDLWAEQHQLECKREVPLGILSDLEPLALVPEVVSVQRLIQGRMQVADLQLDVWLLACLAGTQHRPRPFLLAMLAAHPELPPMRVLPSGEHDAPSHLGYTKLPASGMPDSYRTEAFQPLSIAVTEAVGQVLASQPSDIRLELRPGRLLLAAPAWTKDKPGELLEVGAKLTLALQAVLGRPEPASPMTEDERQGGGCKPGGCGHCN